MTTSETTSKVGAVRETFLNADAGYLLGEPEVTTDLFSGAPGDIFRAAQAEYGGCVSRIFVDTKAGTKTCGWVFQRREKFEDCDETFLREVWVELLERPDTVEHTSHPFWLETA
jgi:hypothetical protein